MPVPRVAGIALVALAVACWPGTPIVGILIYSVAVTLYLGYIGFAGGVIGVLLWPAVVLHAILTVLLTRSILQIMVDFAASIDVPAADITEGRVYSPRRTAEQERMFPALLKVQHGSSPSDDAYMSIRYRNEWNWIDDRDHQSKRALTFLMFMFSLTEGAPAQAAPVVTIPAR